jgi:hypothetical protein
MAAIVIIIAAALSPVSLQAQPIGLDKAITLKILRPDSESACR